MVTARFAVRGASIRTAGALAEQRPLRQSVPYRLRPARATCSVSRPSRPTPSAYLGWLVETHTPFPASRFRRSVVLPREHRADAWLAIGLVLATCATYFIYTPFDDWSYLRFLLPAIALMLVLASRGDSGASAICIRRRSMSDRGRARDGRSRSSAFARPKIGRRSICKFLEQRYRSAGVVVRDRLPANAVVLSVWDSGAVRFHGRKEALTWEGLDAAWLDRSLAWLEQNGRTPTSCSSRGKSRSFRNRFGNHSDVGKLDWPPDTRSIARCASTTRRIARATIAANTSIRNTCGRCAIEAKTQQ